MSLQRSYGTIALVVNPRNGELCQVDHGSGTNINVYSVGAKNIASAYLDTDSDPCQEHTGFPRTHTPSALPAYMRGRGYGTVIYTGLCALAHYDVEYDPVRWIVPGTVGDGVCSTVNNRELPAERWWKAAVEQFGLATRTVSDPVEVEAERNFRGDDDENIAAFLEDNVEDFEALDGFSLRAQYRVMRRRQCDAYPYSAARNKHLIIGLYQHPDDAESDSDARWDDLDPRGFVELDANAIAAINVGMFREQTQSEDMIKALIRLCARANVPRNLAEDLIARYNLGIDADPVFEYNDAYEGSRKTLEKIYRNPARRQPRLVGVRVKRYGTRRNPEPPKAQSESLVKRLVELRKKNGWLPFVAARGDD